MSDPDARSEKSTTHDTVRAGLDANEPGFAQATVAGQLVSYDRYGHSGLFHDQPMPPGMNHGDVMEALILEVACGRGRATALTFSGNFASMMIAIRRALGPGFAAEHTEADAVEALRRTRPELFFR